jgi:predicted DNA-binding transcriptional regulator YafY
MTRLERLFILLPWLKHHEGVSIEEIAAHFRISEEQVIQDVLLLSITGSGQYFGEQFALDWDDDRIYVDDTLGLERPVKFDTAEAATLLLGLEALRTVPGIDVAAVDSSMEKLSSVLPLMSHLHVVPAVDDQTDVVTHIHQALAEAKKLVFDYWNIGRDDKTHREVSPLRAYFKDGVNFMDGYCHTSQGWRTFRLDRMSETRVLAESSELPSETFKEMSLQEVAVSVPSSHQALLEEFVVVSQNPVDQTIEAVVRVFGHALLTRQVLASGGLLSVHGPDHVVAAVNEGVLSALNAYQAK